jgi:hypothetical protein
MENLLVKKTDKAPSVNFSTNGELRIEGRSIMENSLGFYEILVSWLMEFKKTTPRKITLHVNLEYFNSSAGKLLLILFKQLEQIRLEGYDVCIQWYHSDKDEDMAEAGQNYESILKIPFKYVQLTQSA